MAADTKKNRILRRVLHRAFVVLMAAVFACSSLLSGSMISLAATDGDHVVKINAFSTSFRAGGDEVSDPYHPSPESVYIWKATNNKEDHRFTFRINYTHSGTRQYQPGELTIKIPKTILLDRNGDAADYYDLSVPAYDDPEIEALSEAEKAQIKWVYMEGTGEDEDYIIIYNPYEVDAGGNGYIDVSYITDRVTYDYADYTYEGEGSNQAALSSAFVATMTAVQDSQSASAVSDAKYVGLNTGAVINWTEKRYPTFYRSWNSSWGDEVKPSDADDYYYLLWEIRTRISDTTQPYNFWLEDMFENIDGEVVAYKMQEDSKYTLPQSGTTKSRVISGLRTDFLTGRYDYVLTRHSKATYEDVSAYNIINEVTATVDPVDQVDPDTTASSNKMWHYEKPKYTKPTGHFVLWKWGNDYRASGYSTDRDYHVYDSEDIRDFTLDDFKKGKTDSIDDLRYEVQMKGYQWPWTLADGASWQDPSNYGQKAVAYSVYDNEFYLDVPEPDVINNAFSSNYDYDNVKNNYRLGADDYQIDKLMFIYTATDAFFSDERQAFVSTAADYSNDVIEFYAALNGSDSDWVRAAVYHPASGEWTDIDSSVVSSAYERCIEFRNDSGSIVTGWRADYSNKHYMTNLYAFPYVALKDSDYVKNTVADKDKVNLLNINHSDVYETDSGGAISDRIVHFDEAGNDWIIGASRDGHIKKTSTAYKNNKVRRLYTISWNTNLYEDYRINGGTRVKTTQESGIFYDLLPLGGTLAPSSVRVYGDGEEFEEGSFDYEVIKNYRDSGKDLLVIYINKSAKEYTATYDTNHTWESIRDYGVNAVNNVAYETGNEDIGDGYPDNGGNSGVSEFVSLNDDPSDDEAPEGKTIEKFLYARSTHIIDVITAAALNLHKLVKSEDQETYTDETVVYRDSEYSYRIRFESPEDIVAKNLIIYDSLENYTVNIKDSAGNITETRESDWRGIFKSIDLTQVKKLGIDPVVYYSASEKLDIEGNTGAAESGTGSGSDSSSDSGSGASPDYDDVDFTAVLDADGSRVWLTESEFIEKYSSSWKENIHAFAVDMRKDTNGNDYVLPVETAVSITVIMQSPDSVAETSHGRYDTYNNVYMISSVTNADDKEAPDTFPDSELYHQDYTKVTYRATGDIKLTKVSSEDSAEAVSGIEFRLSGTSIYGDVTDETRTSGRDGRFTFRKIPQGDYELQEIKGTADWIEDHTVYHIHISASGAVTIDEAADADGELEIGTPKYSESTGRYMIANEPRIYGTLSFRKKSIEGQINLPGAVFRLEGTSDYGSEVYEYAESSSVGRVIFDDIEKGTYKLTETSAPALGDEKYILGETVWIVTVDEDGNVSIAETETGSPLADVQSTESGEQYILNEACHSFRLAKLDPISNVRLEGAAFHLYGTSDYGTRVDAEQTTDSSGTVSFDTLESGSYVLCETKAPTGVDEQGKAGGDLSYLPDQDTYIVTIDIYGNVSIKNSSGESLAFDGDNGWFVFENERSIDGQIKIIKKWEDGLTNEERLAQDGFTEPKVNVSTEAPALLTTQGSRSLNASAAADTLAAADTRAASDDGTSAGFSAIETADTGTTYAETETTEGGATEAVILRAASDEAEVTATGNVTNSTSICPWTLYSDGRLVIGAEGEDKELYNGSYTSGSSASLRGSLGSYCSEVKSVEFAGSVTLSGNARLLFRGYNGEEILDNLETTDFTNACFGSGVLNLESMFYSLKNLQTVDFAGMSLENITQMQNMFSNCSSLVKVSGFKGGAGKNINMMKMFYKAGKTKGVLDLSDFDTTGAANMSYMFYYSPCAEILLDKFNTENVTNMSCMFDSCNKLARIDVSSFDTSNVTTMNRMFNNCGSTERTLKELDLSSFNTEKVTNMAQMFNSCWGLEILDISGFSTSSLTSYSNMFSLSPTTTTNNYLKAIALGPNTVLNADMISGLKGWNSGSDGSTIVRYATLTGRKTYDDVTLKGLTQYDGTYPGWYKIKGTTAPNEAELAEIYITTVDDNADPDGETDEEKAANVLKWKKLSDDTWEYTFAVFNDSQQYYVWEDALDEYYSDTYAVDYQIMNGSDGTNVRLVTVTNSKTPPVDGKTGELSVSKTIRPADIQSTDPADAADTIDTSKEFVFTITLSGFSGTEKLSGTVTTAGENGAEDTTERCDIIFKDGIGTVYLKHGQTFTLKDLPEGTEYAVTEEALSEYDQEVTQDDGTSGVVYTEITAEELSELGLRETVWRRNSEDQWESAEYYTVKAGVKQTVADSVGEHTGIYRQSTGGSGTISEDDPQDVAFVNVRKTDEESPKNGFRLVKNVKGTLGDLSKEFSFHIALANLDPDTEYSYSITKGLAKTDYTFTSGHHGSAELNILLTDNDAFEISGLPARKNGDSTSTGATYRITENASDHIASYVIADAHVAGEGETYRSRIAQSSMSSEEKNQSLSTASETVDESEEITVTYTNRRDITTETGIFWDTWPWNIILLLVLVYMAYDERMRHVKDRLRRGFRFDRL